MDGLSEFRNENMRERYMEGWLMEDEKVREKQHKTGRGREKKRRERESWVIVK
jgi:hypothetical protein